MMVWSAREDSSPSSPSVQFLAPLSPGSRRGSPTTWGGSSPVPPYSPFSDDKDGGLYQRRSGAVKWGLRRLALLAVFSLAGATVLAAGLRGLGSSQGVRTSLLSCLKQSDSSQARVKGVVPFDKSLAKNFIEPQDSLKVQLKTDVRYVTTMSYGGHANQFISIYNVAYLGKLMNRVIVFPTLKPLHFDAEPEPVSKFFDLERFYAETGLPYLELADLKYFDRDERPPRERVSCWSIHQRVTPGGSNGNDGSLAIHSIDVDFWALPQMRAGSEGWNIWFQELATFDLDANARREWVKTCKEELLPQRKLSPRDHRKPEEITRQFKQQNIFPGFDPLNTPEPSDQFVCYDTTLFVGSYLPPPAFPADPPIEPRRSYEGEGWTEAGQHLRFTPHIEALADQYLAELFNVTSIDQVPPIITIHIRRGDFDEARGLTSLDKYTNALAQVRARLQARIDDPDSWRGAGKENAIYFPGVNAEDYAVVVTTDEKPSSPFYQDLLGLGWKVLDHAASRTEEKYDGWYPTMIDQAVLARGRGFVGTEWSTYSMLSGLRVKYWNGGVEVFTPSLA